MITDKSRRFRLRLFGILYFAQGSVGAFTGNFMTPYLNDFGVDADLIALMGALASIPLAIKVLFGVLSDRVNLFGLGHRVPYMVIGLVAWVIPIYILGFVHPGTQFYLYLVLVVFASFAAVLYDTTGDALAVEITPETEQPLMQSVMGGSLAVGLILMSPIIGWIAASWGYLWVYLLIALVASMPLYWVLQAKEPPRDAAQTRFEWRAFRTLIRPSFLVFLAYGFLAFIASAGASAIITFYLRAQLRAAETQIGVYGALDGIGTLLGTLAASWLVARWGRRTVTLVTAGLLSLGALSFSFATSITVVLALGLLWGMVVGLWVTLYRVLCMSRSDARIAGSMFALSIAVGNVGSAVGGAVATSLTDDSGFLAVFRMLALVNLLVLPLIMVVFRSAGPRQRAGLVTP